MRIVIDRIEDGIATVELENGEMLDLSAKIFRDCKEGDIVYITPDMEDTKRAKKAIEIDVSQLFDE